MKLLTRMGSEFDAATAAAARFIPHDEPGDFVEFLRGKVVRGEASVCDIETASGVVGFGVYSVSKFGTARELLVIAAIGSRDKTDITAEVMPELETLARANDCASIRFHTMRPGLVKKVTAHGYRVAEMILRKTL
ncbi:MAG: hypothetical protein H7343_10220 [Undibacterium sp.]|nr:hypothetical protein [Opitutaceae bacterium]